MREFKVGDYIRVKTEFSYVCLEKNKTIMINVKVGTLGKVISFRPKRKSPFKGSHFVKINGYDKPIPFYNNEMEKITKTDYLIGIL